jgi:hypothetical protein
MKGSEMEEIQQLPTREEILKMSIDGRKQEIMHYQINIDNYTLALQEIAALPKEEQKELEQFANQLNNLLESEKLEQKKSKIMLNVLLSQVKEE